MSVSPTAPIPLVNTTLAAPMAQPPIDPKIKKAAAEFESMVLSQLLAPMFESLDSDGMFGGGSAERMFRPMLVDEYAKGMSRGGGVGLADAVGREMMRLQAGAPAEPAAEKPRSD